MLVLVSAASIACALYVAIEVTIAYQNGNFDPVIFRQVKLKEAWIYFSFSALNVLFLFFSFCGLRMQLKEIFGVSLNPEFRVVRNNFTVLVCLFTFACGFAWGYGSYYNIVCEAYIRWILTACIELSFNTIVIVSCLTLYHKVAQVHETKEA